MFALFLNTDKTDDLVLVVPYILRFSHERHKTLRNEERLDSAHFQHDDDDLLP